MRKLINAEVLEHSMKLQQMGGKINIVNSKLCYVSFDISGFELMYVYNINKKGNYFLERIKPYPLPLKEFESENDVVDIIAIDLEQFKNAIKSHHSSEFVDAGRMLIEVLKKFEDLYLYYNISTEHMNEMMNQLNKFAEQIKQVKSESERLYFKKEPENL
ncbi:MAG: hypothetical protein JXR88_07075 [Clostridia bacterium]|nr:hypothetical protein [Clostridia bacterium]